MPGILNTNEMSKLVILVEEAACSPEEGVKHFVEPGPNTLRRTVSKRHHIVFGRYARGHPIFPLSREKIRFAIIES